MLRCAQIGCGYWGPNLLRNLIHNPDISVEGVLEIDPNRIEYLTKTHPSVKVFSSLNEIINNSIIDAVVIATPANTHFDLCCQVLKNNKHVLVEKPMAMTVEEIEIIDSLAKKNKLIAMAGHTFLYNDAVRYVKALIDKNSIGDIRYIYSQRLNLGRIRSDVDALWNLGVHDISILQYWLDEPEPISINKFGMDYIQNDIHDVVFLNIHYPNNIIANLHVSWLDPQKVRKITIVGSNKMVIYDDLAEDKIKIYDKGIDPMVNSEHSMDFDHQNIYFNYRVGDLFIPKIKYSEPLKNEISHFYDCINKNIKCLSDADHAKKVVKILQMSE